MLILLYIVLLGFGLYLFLKKYQSPYYEFKTEGLLIVSVLNLIYFVILLTSAVNHADNLATVDAQHNIVSVYENRLVRLKSELKSTVSIIKQGKSFTLNGDKPIKGIIESIDNAVNGLYSAKEKRAIAIVDIAKLKAGPLWFVVSIMGEPDYTEVSE